MVLGLLIGIISWFIFRKIIVSIIIFYFVTGLWKSFSWLSLRSTILPPALKNKTIGSFILGVFLWPLYVIINWGDL